MCRCWHGTSANKAPREIPVLDENEEDDALEAFIVDKGMDLDVYLAQKNRTEIHLRSMDERELDQAEKGMTKEWAKLIGTQAIEVHMGEHAKRLRKEVNPERIQESRFV